MMYDGSGNGHDGSNNGAIWVNSCPDEDGDGDGFMAWEDCDDTDASALARASGASQDCAGVSCQNILDDGHSTGDGYYWIQPSGSSPMEVYCDMTTDGGGWALSAVALFANRGQGGWNADGDLNASNLGR